MFIFIVKKHFIRNETDYTINKEPYIMKSDNIFLQPYERIKKRTALSVYDKNFL